MDNDNHTDTDIDTDTNTVTETDIFTDSDNDTNIYIDIAIDINIDINGTADIDNYLISKLCMIMQKFVCYCVHRHCSLKLTKLSRNSTDLALQSSNQKFETLQKR
jgi:hypothetical protein